MPLSAAERLSRKTQKTKGCWIWTGARLPKGYGTISFREDGKTVTRYAHRIAYELAVGKIPDGMEIDHLCDNPSCVRPDHLACVTGYENNKRSNSISAVAMRRTTCARGHEYTAENTQIRKLKSGALARRCRACDRIDHQERRADG